MMLKEKAVTLSVQELQDTFGVFFIGYIMAMIAYGFTFFQTYLYYSRYPMDHWAVKATVATVCLLDTAASTLISHTLYHYLVLLFPYTQGLYKATSTYVAEIGLSVLAVFIVQIFYSSRVWTISKNPIVAGTIAFFSTGAFGLGLAMTAKLGINPSFASMAETDAKAIIATGQGLTFVAALLTFVALCTFLNPSQNPSIKPLRGWYEKLVAYTISRGSSAALVQFGLFIAFIAMPSKPIWMPFHLLSSKLFVNSLIVMLNSRDVYHGRGINEEDAGSRRTNTTASFSASGIRSNSVRFDVVESKPAIDVDITRTIDFEHVGSKITFDDDDPNWHTESYDQEAKAPTAL